MRLTNSDIAELTNWRRMLHQSPEVSGQEAQTALAVVAMLRKLHTDHIITGLGVAAFCTQGSGCYHKRNRQRLRPCA